MGFNALEVPNASVGPTRDVIVVLVKIERVAWRLQPRIVVFGILLFYTRFRFRYRFRKSPTDKKCTSRQRAHYLLCISPSYAETRAPSVHSTSPSTTKKTPGKRRRQLNREPEQAGVNPSTMNHHKKRKLPRIALSIDKSIRMITPHIPSAGPSKSVPCTPV